ncbi:hypothetical protein Tco_1048986 [Tanacetum coccineum]
MESKDMVSSCLDKDEQELQRLCEIKKEMKNKFENIFHNFQICIHGLRPNWFHQSGEYAFQFLFGEKFQSFKNIFDNNIDQLKKQLDKEELHECDSKTCLAVLKKQFDTFFDLKSSLSSSYQYQSELARQKEIFQEYAHYTYQSLKETILAYLNTIDKMIDERACHEEELRIIEKDVKNKQEKLEMEKQETMIQKSEYSSPGDNSDAKREKQEKKENCSKTFQELKMVVLVINPRQLFAKESEFAFEVLFGEDYDSFAYKFYHNLARLENQLSRVENHEGDSKTYLIELRKQCEAFLTNVRERDIIRDLEQEHDKLQLSVTELKRQSLERQKTQTIFKQQLSDKEDKYLNDILQLQTKNKDLENVVCKMGKSTNTLRLLQMEQKRLIGINTYVRCLGY